MICSDYKTCKSCGYKEPYEVISDERGNYTSGGNKGNFKALGQGLYACPACSTVQYKEGE